MKASQIPKPSLILKVESNIISKVKLQIYFLPFGPKTWLYFLELPSQKETKSIILNRCHTSARMEAFFANISTSEIDD